MPNALSNSSKILSESADVESALKKQQKKSVGLVKRVSLKVLEKNIKKSLGLNEA